MAPERCYVVLVIFLAACFTQANGKDEKSLSNDDALYFRDNQKTDVAIETIINAELDKEDVKSSFFKNTKTTDDERIDAVGKPNNRILNVPWWSSFLLALINHFYHQRPQNRSQFGVLYMANTNVPNQNMFPLNFHPSNPDGTPVIDNRNPLSPASSSDFVNYVAARPENVQHTMVHAEEAILNEMNNLWNSYRNRFNRAPNTIVLYSWIMPCPTCTNLIINRFNQAPFSSVPYRVVAYTAEGTNSNLPYMTPDGNRNSRNRLNANNITYSKQQCDRPPDLETHVLEKATNELESHTCKLQDTFQGCVVGCLGSDLCCSCKESRKASMNAALVNNLAKDCATADVTVCARSWVQKAFSEHHSGASYCTDLDSARSKIILCVDNCAGRPLSNPLNPQNPSYYPGYLTKFSDISKYASVDLTDFCSDIRAEGYLCNNYRSDSYTAGNSLCRSGTKCDSKGYSYKWCYTDFSNNWDYCCTSSCGFHKGTSYLWCQSGTKWQYCGDAGDVSVKNRHCLADYPCGMHQEQGKESYYWCYTDTNKNWGYCCQPEDTCSTKGQSYYWCYTGYKKDTTWQYCNR